MKSSRRMQAPQGRLKQLPDSVEWAWTETGPVAKQKARAKESSQRAVIHYRVGFSLFELDVIPGIYRA